MQAVSAKSRIYLSIVLAIIGSLRAMDQDPDTGEKKPYYPLLNANELQELKDKVSSRAQHVQSEVPSLREMALRSSAPYIHDLIQGANTYNYWKIWRYCNSVFGQIPPEAMQLAKKRMSSFCCARTMNFPMPVLAMAVDYKNDKMLTAGKEGKMAITALSGNGPIFKDGDKDLNVIRISKDKQWAVCAGYGDIYLYDLHENKKKLVLRGAHERAEIESLLFINNDSILISSGTNGIVRFWNFTHIIQLLQNTLSNTTMNSTFELKIACDGTISFWKIPIGSGPSQRVYEKKGSNTQCLKGSMIKAFNVPEKIEIRSACVNSDEKILAIAVENDLMVWDINRLETAQCTALLHNAHETAISVSMFMNKKKILISTDQDGKIKLWNISDPSKLISLATISAHSGAIRDIKITADDNFLISAGKDKIIKMWDIADISNPKYCSSLQGHTDSINAVSILENGNQIISASTDSTVKVWELATFAYTIFSRVLSALSDDIEKENCIWLSKLLIKVPTRKLDRAKLEDFLEKSNNAVIQKNLENSAKKHTPEEMSSEMEYKELSTFLMTLSEITPTTASSKQKLPITNEIGQMGATLHGLDDIIEIRQMCQELRPYELSALLEQYRNLLKKLEDRSKANATQCSSLSKTNSD